MTTAAPQLSRKAFDACEAALRQFTRHHETLFVSLHQSRHDGSRELIVRFDTDPDVSCTFGEVPGRDDFGAHLDRYVGDSFLIVFALRRFSDIRAFRTLARAVGEQVGAILADRGSYQTARKGRERRVTTADRHVMFMLAERLPPRRFTYAERAIMRRQLELMAPRPCPPPSP